MVDYIEEENNADDGIPPTLAELLKRSTDAALSELRVSMPAQVVKYDHKKQRVDVKPYFRRTYRDGKSEAPPIIYSVPVAFPRAGDSFIHMPIAKGHNVLLVFSDRSMDTWLSSGKENDPDSGRMHHISDAIAIPGCYPFSSAAPINNAKDIIIKNKKLEIRVKPNSHVQILNGKHELIKVLDEYMKADIIGAHHWKIAVRKKLRTFMEK